MGCIRQIPSARPTTPTTGGTTCHIPDIGSRTWQYAIHARLDEVNDLVDATANSPTGTIRPDTLRFAFFHLYANAAKRRQLHEPAGWAAIGPRGTALPEGKQRGTEVRALTMDGLPVHPAKWTIPSCAWMLPKAFAPRCLTAFKLPHSLRIGEAWAA
jgi:hypothetical protein